ncbi:hypothetical protein K4K56_010361 [Colletotrichum sp. SAR 10_98]|nr:hypothetical protein K4K56_010361 [Colletotrichum sp. SAR 10_98]
MKWSLAVSMAGLVGSLAHPGQRRYLNQWNETFVSGQPVSPLTQTASTSVPLSTSVTFHPPDDLTRTLMSTIGTVSASDAVVAATAASSSMNYEFPTSKLGPIATLKPAIPDNHDLNDVNHLTPQPIGAGAPIHFAQDAGSNGGGIFAVATPKWTSPSIVLDHSGLVIDVKLSGQGSLVMTFGDQKAFDHGASNWKADNIIFVTYTPECGDYDLGQRCYFQASSVMFDRNSLSATATGQAKDIGDVTKDINVVWGNYGSQSVNYGNPAVPAEPTAAENRVTPVYSVAPTMTAACVAPVDRKYGLPTACLGPYFDDDLDTELGYVEADVFSFNKTLYEVDLDGELTDSTLTRRTVFDSIGKGFEKIGQATKSGIITLGNKIEAGAKAAKNDVVKTGEKVVKIGAKVLEVGKAVVEVSGNILAGKPNRFEKDFDKLLLPRPAKECKEAENDKDKKERLKNACKPKKQDKDKESEAKAVRTPWGDDALLLKSFGTIPSPKDQQPKGSKKQSTVTKGNFINLYCVKCGLSGSLKTKGNITIDIVNGITDGYIESDVDISVGVGLGIYAQYYQEHKFRNNLYDIPLSPFTLGFVTVGPILSIGTEAKFSLNMTGTAVARADVSIARAKFVYDWKKGSANSFGFKPQFKPSFEAEGQVEIAAQFGIPVGLEFGVTTFNGCPMCKGSIGFETMPSIKAAAAIAVQAKWDSTDGLERGLKPLNNCSGISTTLSVRNDVTAKLKGFSLVDKDWSLHETKDYILASYCIGNKTDGTSKAKLGLHDDKRSLPSTLHNKYEYSRDANDVSVPMDTTTNSAQLADLTKYVVEEIEYLNYNGSDISAIPYDLDEAAFDGYWFSTLALESDNSYVLAACSDGNVYLQKNTTQNDLPYYVSCNTLWAGYGEAALLTPTGEVLHYYNNTMDKIGVSRLRAGYEASLPGTSVYVALTPFYYDDNNSSASMLAAIDPEDNIFFPAVCTYKGDQTAKIYLVGEDVDAGLEMLKSPDLTYTVTNGEVDECYLLFLGITNRELGEWADYGDDVTDEYESDPLYVEFDDTLFDTGGDLLLPADELLPYQDDVNYDDVFDESLDEIAWE